MYTCYIYIFIFVMMKQEKARWYQSKDVTLLVWPGDHSRPDLLSVQTHFTRSCVLWLNKWPGLSEVGLCPIAPTEKPFQILASSMTGSFLQVTNLIYSEFILPASLFSWVISFSLVFASRFIFREWFLFPPWPLVWLIEPSSFNFILVYLLSSAPPSA